MCYADAPGVTSTTPCNVFAREVMLDCNHDDYFHTNPAPGSYLATRWNVAESKYLAQLPQSHWGVRVGRDVVGRDARLPS